MANGLQLPTAKAVELMSSDFSRTLALLCLAAFFASCGGGGSGDGDPAPPPPPAAAVTSVAVTCTSTALQTSGTTQCMANVQGTGAFNTALQWSVEGGGEVDADGLFAAPAHAATVTLTASSVSHPNESGAVTITVSRPRTLVDLADDESGYQVHLLYVVASDGEDRELDTNGAVERSVEAWNEWLAEQTSDRRLRLDRSDGALDVTFVRLDRTDAELNAFGALIRDHMEAELILKGFNDPEKIYAVYYDGGDEQTGACGSAARPPTLLGTVSAIYLRAVPAGGAPCDTNALAAAVDAPGYLEFSSVHEIVHTLGFVADCAPNNTRNQVGGPATTTSGHVSDSNTDLMYAGPLGWNPSVLDVNGDDYFEAGLADCLDLADSAFLDPLPASAEPPPGWPYETLLGTSCAREGAMRSTSPGVDNTTGLHFFNGTGARINVYWLDYSGPRQFRDTVQPYGYSRHGTYAAHSWVVTDETNRCLGIYKVGKTPGRAIIEPTDIASLDVSGAMPLTSIGGTVQLALAASLVDGSNRSIVNASVRWESSDSAVATVIDGTVTAVGGGNAQIIASYEGQVAVSEISVHISVREPGTVRVLYAAPSDREFRSEYRDAIQHAIVDLQSWFRQQTGGLTFSLYDATPEQCQLSETADYYDQDTWQRVLDGVQHCAPVRNRTSTFVWVVYADLDSQCDVGYSLGRGEHGLTMLPREDLEGLIGNRLVNHGVCGDGPWPGPVTRWIGGLGHELGHAFTLPHPPGCDEGLPTCDYDALMYLGFEMYPETYLRPDNKEVLLRSSFVGRDPAHRPLTEDTVDTSAIRGTVTDPEGNALGGIRVSAVADSFWSWGETASDGTFEILLPAGSSGSSLLSVHTGGTADCGWLGYYRAGGLTTLRERAVPIRFGETDAASIEIRLPNFPGQLCTGQRIVSGAVLGPDGEPVELWVGGGLFDTWNWTGTDGRFEVRQPTVASALWINTAQCGNIGYYADGGVTTRLADAAPFALGGVDETDIQIRLSHTTAELCSRQIVISGTVVGPHGDAIEGITVESQPFRRGGSSGPDGAFELRLLEGTTGVAVLAITATCGRVGYYGPNGFTASRRDATEIEIGQGNVAGIEIRLPVDVNDLCV